MLMYTSFTLTLKYSRFSNNLQVSTDAKNTIIHMILPYYHFTQVKVQILIYINPLVKVAATNFLLKIKL